MQALVDLEGRGFFLWALGASFDSWTCHFLESRGGDVWDVYAWHVRCALMRATRASCLTNYRVPDLV